MENLILPVYLLKFLPHSHEFSICLKEFKDKKEFQVNVIDVVKENGKKGIWKAIQKAVQEAKRKDEDICVISKESHCFSEDYDFEKLLQDIFEAHRLGAKYLLGGIEESFSNSLILPSNLCWIDHFRGSSFIVLFKSFYDSILKEIFLESEDVDEKLSEMTSVKFVVYPFMSYHVDSVELENSFLGQEINHALKNRKDIEKRLQQLFEKTKIHKIYF